MRCVITWRRLALLVAFSASAVRGLLVQTRVPQDAPSGPGDKRQHKPAGASVMSKGTRLATVSQVLRAMLDVLDDGDGEESYHPLKIAGQEMQMPFGEVCEKFGLSESDCDRVPAYVDSNIANSSSPVIRIHTQLQPLWKFHVDQVMGMSLSTLLEEVSAGVHGDAVPQAYWSDLREVLSSSLDNASSKLSRRGILFSFGDNGPAPCYPTIQKTRELPTSGNDVLLNLNTRRHWNGVADVLADDKPFAEKQDQIVWRGSSTGLCKYPYTSAGDVRMRLATKYYGSKDARLDVGFNSVVQGCWAASKYVKEALTIDEQLDNKFLLALQGNDKATGLNWMMASNSVVFMPPPTIESWLLETRLVPWKHYIPLRQDLDDLVEQLDWAMEHPKEAEAIAQAGRQYIKEFLAEDEEKEFRIGAAVLTSYMQRVRVVDDIRASHREAGAVISGDSSAPSTLSSCDCVPQGRDFSIRSGLCNPIDYQQRAHNTPSKHTSDHGHQQQMTMWMMAKMLVAKLGQLMVALIS